MINFSLNTCWRLIPTYKKQKVVEHDVQPPFFLFPSKYSHHHQQIACQAQHGSHHNTLRRKDIGIESLLSTAWSIHQQIANSNKEERQEDDETTGGQKEKPLSLWGIV